MNKEGSIVVVLGGTKVPRGGLTHSALNRASQLAARGRSTHLYTFDYRPDFPNHIRDLRGQGLLHEDVHFHNFYETTRGNLSPTDTSDFVFEPSKQYLVEQVESPRFTRFFNRTGQLAFSELRGDGGSMWRRYYTDSRVEKTRIEYSVEGTLHRKTVFLDDSPQISSVSYLTEFGSAYFTQWTDKTGKFADVFVAAPDGTGRLIRYSTLENAQESWFRSEVAKLQTPVTVMLDDCTMAPIVKTMTLPGTRRIAIYHNDHNTPAHRTMNESMSSWDAVVCSTIGQAGSLREFVPPNLSVTNIPQPIPDAASMLTRTSRAARSFAFFGRLTEVKNVMPLVRAFRQVVNAIPDAVLDIFGEGPEEKELRSLIGELELGGHVRLMGRTDEALLRMTGYSAIVLPSTFEAFGLVIGEAMLAETPVIAFDCDFGPREIIRDGVDGILVPCEDFDSLVAAMVKVGLDSGLAQRMGVNGRINVLRRFSNDAIISRWERLVDDLHDIRSAS